MKKLNLYIIEKLKVNSEQAKVHYLNFCQALDIKDCSEAEKLYEYYKKYYFEDSLIKLSDSQRCSSDFELILMLCVMLIDDGYTDPDYIEEIGYKSYKGNNNPYDYSWFEDENEDGNDVLTIIQQYYNGSLDFKKLFKDFFELVKKLKTITVDNVWDLTDNMQD